MTLKAQPKRCMLAALADGDYFAIGRGDKQKTYRRSYGMGGHVVGLPVTANGEQIVGAEPAIFTCPSLTMVHPVTTEGAA